MASRKLPFFKFILTRRLRLPFLAIWVFSMKKREREKGEGRRGREGGKEGDKGRKAGDGEG